MIYIYKYQPIKPTEPASFNVSYSDSFDSAELEKVEVKASFGRSFGKAFNNVRKPAFVQTIYIHKTEQAEGTLYFYLHNVAENEDLEIDVEDLGMSKGYYTFQLNGKDVAKLAEGEYLYYLRDSKEERLLSQGIVIVKGLPLEVVEETENIEFNEYGNRT